MTRAAIYVRVSHEEQKKHGLSVDSQLLALQEYCNKNNYDIAGVYNDAGISARKKYTNRPALLNLLNDCKQNKIDIILFTKLDRWFRSVADYYEVQSVLEKCNVPWKAIWEDYDTVTANGVLKVNIMLSVAQSEADKTSERIKAVFDYKRAKGDYIGPACLGYKRENKKLVKDEATAPIIEALFDNYRLTKSVTLTHRNLKALGYTLHKDTVRSILKKETYTGNANGYDCYAYISYQEYQDNLKSIASRTCKVTTLNYDYIFSGLIRCGMCGGIVPGRSHFNTHKDGVKVPCRYYSCEGKTAAATHTKYQTMSELKIEQYLLDNLDAIISAHNSEKIKLADNDTSSNNDNKIIQLQNKLERVGIRFEDGDISVEEYREKRSQLQNEIKELQSGNVGSITPIIIPQNWQNIYASFDNIHKRAFWKSFIDCIILSEGDNKKRSLEIRFK